MMNGIFKNILLLFLLVGVTGLNVQANNLPAFGKTEFTKTVKKNYKMSADGEVSLSNKYGNVNLQTWDRNEVNIEVTITVKSRNESNANDIFERININFSNNSSFVKAVTEIESKNSNWWGSGDKGDFRIDYEVSMPKAASLDLRNKYGDSNIDNIGGDANIVVKYGNFDLKSVGADTKIDLGYGHGNIGRVNGAQIDVKYSKIKLKEASKVSLESKYSKVYIDQATTIKCVSKYDSYAIGELKELSNEGKYDHFEIEKVDEITASSRYTDYKVEELANDGAFELRYGGVSIGNLLKGFNKVMLDCEYADCKIYMEDNVAFQLDALVNYGSIRYPENTDVSYEKQKNSSHEIKGSRGSSGAGIIKARLSHGSLKLK